MTKQSTLLVLILTILAVLLGYNYFFKPFANKLINQQAATDTENQDQVLQLPKNEVSVDSLDTRSKILQMLMVPVLVDNSFADSLVASKSAQIQWVETNNPGFAIIFGSNISMQSLQNTVLYTSGANKDLPVKIAVDHEGGSVQRLKGDGFTSLDAWREMCRKDLVKFQVEYEGSAQELADGGIDIVFAPVVDVGEANRALDSRLCSQDHELVLSRSLKVIDIFKRHNILPVIKHFPGIGKVQTDLHFKFDTVVVEKLDAALFVNLLDHDPNIGVMVAHVGVENQIADLPCSLSADCVGQLVKNYPDTLIFTDDLLMDSAYNVPESYAANGQTERPTLSQVSERAIRAGNDVLVYGRGVSDEDMEVVVNDLASKYESDLSFKMIVDKAVEKIINYKIDNTNE